MDRAERTGLAIALVGHGALFTALTIGLSTPPDLPKIVAPPVEVTLTSEIAAQSSSPALTEPTPPAPPAPQAVAASPPPPVPIAAPPPPVAAPPMRPRPLPPVEAAPSAPAPRPKPATKAETRPKPPPRAKAEMAKAKPVTSEPTERRRPGLSKSIVTGLADPVASEAPAKAPASAQTKSNAASSTQPATVPAAQMTGAQKASLTSLIYTQLKPHWRPPSGADAELLVTLLSVRLKSDGSLAADPEVIAQRGINDSNRAQARLHADRAIQAVRRAAPFTLPPQFYDGWKWLNPLTFDGRLSR